MFHFLLLDLVLDFFLRGDGERDVLDPDEVLGERRRFELLPLDRFLTSCDEVERDRDLERDFDRDLDRDRDLLDLLWVSGVVDLERDRLDRILVAKSGSGALGPEDGLDGGGGGAERNELRKPASSPTPAPDP